MRWQTNHGHLPGRRPDASRNRLRPRLEGLEGRAVPASYAAASVPELIASINAANATAEADTITLAAGTTFTLTAVDNTADGPTGLPVIAAGEDLTVVGNGAVIERGGAAGTPAFRLLDVAAGGTLTLRGLTLRGGLALGSPVYGATPAWSQGGAIYNKGALTQVGVTVRGNTARGYDGPTGLWAGTIPGGPAAGGGIYSEGTLSVEDSTIADNVAIGGRGSDGFGGLANRDGGRGGEGAGGGLSVGGGSAVISRSVFTANTARGGDGGTGLSVPKDVDNAGRPTPGGDGGDGRGGAIHAAAGSVSVRASEITSNLAQGGAGGAGGTGGRRRAADGAAGLGVGGALFIVDPTASVGLDDYTLKHLRRNKASSRDANIYGSYTLIA